MKANELMIGDWVNVVVKWKPEIKYMYGEVSELLAPDGYLKVRQSYDPYHDNEIYCICDTEPILLTPEILKKNGFKEVDMNDFRLFRDKEYDCKGIRISFTNKGVCLWKGDSIGISCKSSGCCHYGIPAYVHLLQHALRLCGIEKEIVL